MTGRRIVVVCRPEVGSGFALAGLPPLEIDTAEEGAARIRELLARDDVGVILVEDAYYDRLPEEVRREMAKRAVPLVVPFPGPAWAAGPADAEAYVVELLRQVIGYRVRLQ